MTERENEPDMEPEISRLLDRKLWNRASGPYSAYATAQVAAHLERALPALRAQRLVSFARMSGGASKEQFLAVVTDADGLDRKFVVRMDPLESLVETSRQREAELLLAVSRDQPVPPMAFLDEEAVYFPRPTMVSGFVRGVAQPSEKLTEVLSGISTLFSKQLADRLAPEFVDKLVAIHAFDWRSAELPSFGVPDAGSTQAALWQINWWARVLHEDRGMVASECADLRCAGTGPWRLSGRKLPF